MSTKDLILKILQLLDDSLDDENLNEKLFDHKALGVSKNRLYYVLEMMKDTNLIKDISFIPNGNKRVPALANIHYMKITTRGIAYLDDNTTTAKIIKAAKLLKDTVPMI